MAISDKTKRKILIAAHIAAVPFALCMVYYPIQTILIFIIVPLLGFVIKSKW